MGLWIHVERFVQPCGSHKALPYSNTTLNRKIMVFPSTIKMVLLNNPRDPRAWRACDWLFGPHFMMIGRPICTIASVKIEWPISNFLLKDEKNEKICGQMQNNSIEFSFLQWDAKQEFPPRVEKLLLIKKRSCKMCPKCLVQFLILSTSVNG